MSQDIRSLALPALAAVGLGDSTYLTITRLQGELPACGEYSGCAQVNTSAYAEVGGVPVAFLGAGMYVVLLALSVVRLRLQDPGRGMATLGLFTLVLAASVFSVYLTAIELFVLEAVCYWCLVLTAVTLLLLVLLAPLALRTHRDWTHETAA